MTATAESIAAELAANPEMPGYLRDPALHDQLMAYAEAEASARHLRPAYDAALDADDTEAMMKLSGAYHRAAGRALNGLHRLGLTPLGRAEGFPRIPA